MERLLEVAEMRGSTGSGSPARSVVTGGSGDVRDGEPVTPRTVGGESARGGLRRESESEPRRESGARRESEPPRESTGVMGTAEGPETAERAEGVTPAPETTMARVIEEVEVGSVQIDSLFRL